MVRPVPAGRRGSCCTPYSRLQEEIDNVETIAVTANNTANNASQLAQQALTRDTFDDVNVNGDLNVYGDIIQQGAAYETHAQHVFSTDDYIVMRDGALVGLAVGDYSGFQVKKYDGTNDGRLVMDKDGVARVGDVGDEQPLLTRDESADMVDAAPLVWDAANSKAVSGAFPVPDPGVASINGISPDADNDFTIEAGTGVTIASGTNKITINASGGGEWVRVTPMISKWSDIFYLEDNKFHAYKDTIVSFNTTVGSIPVKCRCYFQKGMLVRNANENLYIPVTGTHVNTSTHALEIAEYIFVNSGNLSNTSMQISVTVITGALGNDATSSTSNKNANIQYTVEVYQKD